MLIFELNILKINVNAGGKTADGELNVEFGKCPSEKVASVNLDNLVKMELKIMRDGTGRIIDYLRISVTDRCNFRCKYCMPPEGVHLQAASEMLTYEELLRIITILAEEGITKIRITGGEPLVRKGIVEFISRIRTIKTIEDLSITTNGSLLANMAAELRAGGLDRVNISIDTINFQRFTSLTGNNMLMNTLMGIEKALEVGFHPIKLNVVLIDALHAEDVYFFIDLVRRSAIDVRFIEYMPLRRCNIKAGFSIDEIKALINGAGYGILVPNAVLGNGPAKYYKLPHFMGSFGFITPMSQHFCYECNRIRLTADGKFKLCLLSDKEIDVKSALRSGASDEIILGLFHRALAEKPAAHRLKEYDSETGLARGMSQIGG